MDCTIIGFRNCEGGYDSIELDTRDPQELKELWFTLCGEMDLPNVFKLCRTMDVEEKMEKLAAMWWDYCHEAGIITSVEDSIGEDE